MLSLETGSSFLFFFSFSQFLSSEMNILCFFLFSSLGFLECEFSVFMILCRWSKIAAQLPGRTDNEIKNLWNTHIKKKLFKMGVHPITHKPISSSENSSDEPLRGRGEEDRTPTVSLCSDSEKSLASSSVSSSASSSNLAPLIKDEAIEIPTIDWDEPMWLLEMNDFKGFEFLSSDLDSNICFSSDGL
jgi:hypothetical protein